MRRLRILRQSSAGLSAGDTIVEVLIAITVFALVLAATITSTGRSLHSGTDATNRQQAISLAQQQVEYIKNALSTNLATLQGYTTYSTQPFCIDVTTGQPTDNSKNPSKPPCKGVNNTQYNIAITTKAGADNSTLFTVTATWTSSVSNTTDTTSVYYKVPQAGLHPPIVSTCSSTVTSSVAPGAVTLTGTIDPVGSGTSWHFAYGTTTALGTNAPVPDSVIAASASPTNVREDITGLGAGSYYYTLVATNSDGTDSCSNLGTFTINAPPPPPPTVTLAASPNPITSGKSSQLTWTVTGNATSCTPTSSPGDSSWNGSTPNPAGGNFSVSPTATTTYYIQCTGPGGQGNQANVAVVVTSPFTPPTVNLISVTNNASDDTYHVYGQVNPNNTANTHPYISIGRTCDSGADSDNPDSGPNSGISRYENPLGPFSDSTTHDEHADMLDTQFSFYFCGPNNPYKFQQCAWWGTDITNWLPNHICSNEIDLFQGSASGTGGGGSGGNGLPVCFINVANDGQYTAYVVGADCEPHDNNGISFTFSATGFYCSRINPKNCGPFNSGTQPGSSYTFDSQFSTWVNLSVTFVVSACNANGCNSSNPSDGTTSWR